MSHIESVFESKSKEILKEMAKFFASRLATLGMEMIIMFIFGMIGLLKSLRILNILKI